MTRTHIIKTAYMPLGKASVNVEYELVDDEAQVLNVYINGMWTDPQDWIAPSVFDGWQEELTRGHREDMARLHADGRAFLKRVQEGQGAWILGAEQARAMDETAGIVGEAA
jgi:hypothetical protein